MVLANLEDLIGTRLQTNLPGTVDQHPNWCRKLGATVEDLVGDPRAEQVAALLRVTRPVV